MKKNIKACRVGFILLQGLKKIKKEVPEVGTGLCYNISEVVDILYEDVQVFSNIRDYLFTSWDSFSGNIRYPVYCPESTLSVGDQYNSQINYFDEYINYGRLRWDLLDHMITTLEKELGV